MGGEAGMLFLGQNIGRQSGGGGRNSDIAGDSGSSWHPSAYRGETLWCFAEVRENVPAFRPGLISDTGSGEIATLVI